MYNGLASVVCMPVVWCRANYKKMTKSSQQKKLNGKKLVHTVLYNVLYRSEHYSSVTFEHCSLVEKQRKKIVEQCG